MSLTPDGTGHILSLAAMGLTAVGRSWLCSSEHCAPAGTYLDMGGAAGDSFAYSLMLLRYYHCIQITYLAGLW